MTIDWQVIAQYDNDRLTRVKAQNEWRIEWEVKTQYDDEIFTSENAIWWK